MKSGQKVYLRSIKASFVVSERYRESTIKKVGKKYAHLEDGTRFFISSMKHDGGNYSPRYIVYQSLEELEKAVELDKMKYAIQQSFSYGVPSFLSDDEIRAIYEMTRVNK